MYVSQEAETLAVHSLLTIQDTEAIKKEFKEFAKMAGFRSVGHILSLQHNINVMLHNTIITVCHSYANMF